jgi:hypothetical protein
MRRSIVVAVALGAVVLSGCVIGRRRSGGHIAGGASVSVSHDYTYFPSHNAYHCRSCDDWWVHDGITWSLRTERPRGIYIQDDTPWVSVKVRDGNPHLLHAEHSRSYPSNWRPGKPQGPPPGRGGRR